MYSASVVESTMVAWQFAHQDTAPLAMVNTYPEVDHQHMPMSSIHRSSSLDWKKDWNQTEPNCKRWDHWLQLHKFWNFSVASCNVCWKIEKPKKNRSRLVATGLSSCHVLDLTHAHFSLIVGLWIIKNGQNWLRYSQKHFYMQLECMSLPFSPYPSQILTKLLETLTSLQRIKISIHICNLCEVTLFLFSTINFTTKNRLQLVWTGFFRVVDRLGLVFKGLIAVPEYLKWSRLVAVASCLVLKKKTELKWTQKHHQCLLHSLHWQTQ